MNQQPSNETANGMEIADIQKVRWLERTRASDAFRDATGRGLQHDAHEAVTAYFNLVCHSVYDHHQLEYSRPWSTKRLEANTAVSQQLYGSAALMANLVQKMTHRCNDPEELLRYAEIPITLESLEADGSELRVNRNKQEPHITLDPEPAPSELWQTAVLGEEGVRQAIRKRNLAHMIGLILLKLSDTTKLQVNLSSLLFWSPERAMGEQIFARNFASEFVAGPPKTGSIKTQLAYLQAQNIDLESMGRVLAYRNDAFTSVGLTSTNTRNPVRWSQEFGRYSLSEEQAGKLHQTVGIRQATPDEIPNARPYVAVMNSDDARKVYYLPRA